MRALLPVLCGLGVAWWPLLHAAPLPGELALPPLVTGDEPPAPELVTFRTKHLDDRGLNRSIRNISQPTLTLFLPEQPRHRGVVIICPGGAYAAVELDREGLSVARYFASQGLACAVLKYRLPLPAETPGALPRSQEDALSAIRYLRKHGAELGLSGRVGIMGFSAGGHLAGSTAFLGKGESRPDFLVMLYPVVSMVESCAHPGSRRNLLGDAPAVSALETFSLERRAGRDWPPVFLAHARDDKVVPFENSRLLAEALQKQGAAVEWWPVASGGHGFSLGRGPDSDSWKERFLAWLDALP